MRYVSQSSTVMGARDGPGLEDGYHLGLGDGAEGLTAKRHRPGDVLGLMKENVTDNEARWNGVTFARLRRRTHRNHFAKAE